jgi:hypothetical protein
MATGITDNLDSYSDGGLDSQGGWTAHTDISVQGTTTQAGAKAAQIDIEGYANLSTDFGEVDPNSHIARTSSRITFTGLARDEGAFAHDFKQDYWRKFDSFVHYIDIRITSADNDSWASVWALSVSANDVQSLIDAADDEAIIVGVETTSGTTKIKACDINAGSLVKDGGVTISLNTTYYLTIIKGKATYFSCDVFSDSARTSLVGTTSITIRDLADYDYQMIAQSYNTGGTEAISGWVENLKRTTERHATRTFTGIPHGSQSAYFRAAQTDLSATVLNIQKTSNIHATITAHDDGTFDFFHYDGTTGLGSYSSATWYKGSLEWMLRDLGSDGSLQDNFVVYGDSDIFNVSIGVSKTLRVSSFPFDQDNYIVASASRILGGARVIVANVVGGILTLVYTNDTYATENIVFRIKRRTNDYIIYYDYDTLIKTVTRSDLGSRNNIDGEGPIVFHGIRSRIDSGSWTDYESPLVAGNFDPPDSIALGGNVDVGEVANSGTFFFDTLTAADSIEVISESIDLSTWIYGEQWHDIDIVSVPLALTTSLLAAKGGSVVAQPIVLSTTLTGDTPVAWSTEFDITTEEFALISGGGTGVYRPWNHSNFMDVGRVRGRTYPPKDAQPWRYHSYPEMEYFVGENEPEAGPLPIPNVTPIDPSVPTKDICAGRSLLAVATPSTVECRSGEGISLGTVGAIGGVTWTLLDPLNNAMSMEDPAIPLNPCAGTNGGFITFAACDECCRLYGGGATVSVFIEACDTPACDGPYIEITGVSVDETVQDTTKQYGVNNSVGTIAWSVSGVGATISDTGLLTTDENACGTLTVSAEDCCSSATQEVRVTDSGFWSELPLICSVYDPACNSVCTVIEGGHKTEYTYRIHSDPDFDCFYCGCAPCYDADYHWVCQIKEWKWECLP